MAKLGCEVTAIENNDLVFVFLDFFNKNPEGKPRKLNFILDDSLHYLKTIKAATQPDVIYMDPMFPPKKSASGKPLWILQQITHPKREKTLSLFQEALKIPKKRVVVKRGKREKPFKGPLLCSFPGRAVRFDVFAPIS